MPRPKVLTPERRRELVAYVSAGMRVEHAARYVGCSARTVRREADRNDQFRVDLAAAELAVRSDPEKLMGRAAGSHWRAAAWMLERREPHRFGRRRADSCGPRELEEICTTIMEVALAAASDDRARRELYLKMVAALREVTTDLFPPPLPARSPLAFHRYTEEQRLFDLADETSAFARRTYGDPFGGDASRAQSDAAAPAPKSANATDKPSSRGPTPPPAAESARAPARQATAPDDSAWPRPQRQPITLQEFLDRERDNPPTTFLGVPFCPNDRDNSTRLRRQPKSPQMPRAEQNGPHPSPGEDE
ncbi:MAG: hypothetical protein JNL18_13880 [Planctomycetaceae bacterium]|nr:hypothetical protein [Planctomycetaceae bacterium]